MPQQTRHFWKDILKRSGKETLAETFGLRSWEQFVIKGVYAVAILAALWWAGSTDAGWDQIIQYLAVALAIPVVFIGLWTWNFIRLPAKDSAGKDLKIADLESVLQLDKRRIAIKEKLGVALSDGQKIMNECRAEGIERTDLEDRANKWYEGLHNFVTACFGGGEANYLRHGVDGGVVYSDGSKPNEDLRLNIQRALKQLTHILQGADTKPIRDDFKI